ncbi:hypothetical protein Sjap_018825 [Stephania japonica]|uniref:Uncharacterized protein n=1 Tax=Stephania japonica TaxID=461633 RepID=A0AAP0I8T4_9MAGN
MWRHFVRPTHPHHVTTTTPHQSVAAMCLSLSHTTTEFTFRINAAFTICDEELGNFTYFWDFWSSNQGEIVLINTRRLSNEEIFIFSSSLH